MGQSCGAKRLKSIKKNKNNRLTPSNKILDLLTASMCILACFNHFLLPSSFLEPYMNHFLSITLPQMKSTFLQPTYIFVVVNAIIVFLIAQSMLGASPSSSADDLYDEYVNRINRGKKDFKVYDSVPKKRNNKERDSKEDCISEGHGVVEVRAKRTGKLLEGKVVVVVEEEEKKEELPAEELNEEVGEKGTRKLLEEEGKLEEEEEEELPAEELNEKVGAEGTRKLLEEGKLEEQEEELPAEELDEEAGAIEARKSLQKGTPEEEEKELPPEKLNEEAGAKGTRRLLEKSGVEEEEEEELPTEELNRRIEAFIHRINKRRSLEARSLICIET